MTCYFIQSIQNFVESCILTIKATWVVFTMSLIIIIFENLIIKDFELTLISFTKYSTLSIPTTVIMVIFVQFIVCFSPTLIT